MPHSLSQPLLEEGEPPGCSAAFSALLRRLHLLGRLAALLRRGRKPLLAPPPSPPRSPRSPFSPGPAVRPPSLEDRGEVVLLEPGSLAFSLIDALGATPRWASSEGGLGRMEEEEEEPPRR